MRRWRGRSAWLAAAAWTFARALLGLGVLNFLLFSILTAAISRTLAAPSAAVTTDNAAAIAGTLTLADFGLFRQFTNGLETGLYTILVGCCVLLSLRQLQARRSNAETLVFGLAAGLAALARIDFLVVLLVYLVTAWLLRRLSFTDAVISGAIGCIVASPWLLRVHALTGRWVPSSGLAQAGLVSWRDFAERVWLMALAAVQQVSPWLHVEAARIAIVTRLPPRVALAATVLLVSALVGIAITLVRPAARSLDPGARRVLAAWVIAFTALFAAYPTFFYATYFYPRYATPLVAIGLPLVAVGIAARLDGLMARAAVVVVPIAFVGTALFTLHNGSLGNVNVLTADYVQRWLPPGEHVGAFQSGVVGYFNANVVNLDGKINADALAAAREGNLPGYIDAQRIRYLADWPSILAILPPAYLQREWTHCPAATPDVLIECLVRK